MSLNKIFNHKTGQSHMKVEKSILGVEKHMEKLFFYSCIHFLDK